MKLRGIHPNDTAEIKRIHLLAFEGVGETANTVSAILRDKKFGNIVAEVDGRVVGYSFFHQQGKSLYLNWIAVLPEAEGTGASQIMLQEVEQWANREGLNTIVLDSRNRFKRAITFYLKNGFDIIGSFLHSDGELMIRLSKKIILRPL